LDKPSDYRKELGINEDAKVVLFSGSLGGKQGLMVIPEAARKLAHRKDLIFIVCGDGVMKPQLVAASAELPNIRFLPLQPFSRLGQLLGLADMHLLPQSPDAADLVLPSKLTGMLASGRPVIAMCQHSTEIARLVTECGLVVAPEDGSALADAIEKLADNDDLRVKLGAKARHSAKEKFEKHSVLNRLVYQLRFVTNTVQKAVYDLSSH
jgi:colanic acid biosynthesis glycosyl transferase WcaI